MFRITKGRRCRFWRRGRGRMGSCCGRFGIINEGFVGPDVADVRRSRTYDSASFFLLQGPIDNSIIPVSEGASVVAGTSENTSDEAPKDPQSTAGALSFGCGGAFAGV